MCKELYKKPGKSYDELLIIKQCSLSCEYAEGSYPVKGFIRASWGKQTFKNNLGQERMCFLSYLNVQERNRKIQLRREETKAERKLLHSLQNACQVECQLEYDSHLDMCFQFHHNLGYDEGEKQDWIYRFSAFTGLIIFILMLVSLLFLAPAGNIQLFFMLFDLLQLYHIWGLRAKKSFDKKRILKNLKYANLDFTAQSWLVSLATKIFPIKDTELLNKGFLDVINENNLKITTSTEYFYEDFL